ncbi:MAG: PqqD family protein [Armatimonadetes bacterium]|nr:MAG: PqqD family protein [Armatimonadota bacterium]
MKRKGRQPDKRQWLRMKPARARGVEWHEEEGRVVIQDSRAPSGLRGRLFALLKVPSQRSVELDELGSHVWKLCDGRRTLRQIAIELKDEFRITQAEAEASLLAFLTTLERRGYISLGDP